MSRRAAKAPKALKAPKVKNTTDLPKEAAHKALRGAGGDDGRAGEKASVRALEVTEAYLEKIGKEARELLKIKKMETVKPDTLDYILQRNPCHPKAGIIAAFRGRKYKAGETRIRDSTADRIFSKAGGDLRTSADAKKYLGAIANGYLALLSEKAAFLASVAGRKGVKVSDIENAVVMLGTL